MNIPLVRNDLIPNFRSTSPPTNRTTNKIARERSPPTQNYLSRHDSVPRNQLVNAPALNPAQKTGPNESDAFRVYVRLRPLNSKEISNNTTRKGSTVEARDDMVFVFDPENPSEVTKKEKVFVFDNVFGDAKSTEEIYQETLTPALENMVQGFNSTIFAYGMTGAGKTYTMFGDIYNSNGGMQYNPGLVNLMVRDIFQTFSNESSNYEFFMKMSYIEIYNEQIRDLLNPSAENLMVVEDPGKGVMISNISEFSIQSEHELLKHIFAGNSKRIMATTHANQFSSRSHAIIQLTVEKRSRVRDIQETYTQSKLCFVDLAGSERAATTENRGIRMQEGANINRSLLALGNCINILSDANKKGAFVPYRDSKLTRLLKDSLGGNTRTIMLACVSPASIAYEETVNTLNYASRARKIKKKVMSNIKEVELHVSQYKEIIESLRNEIGSLKEQLETKGGDQIQVVRRAEVLDSAAGSMNQVDEGSSLDALGKALFANLEENWEISQSLKELRDLKKQNEEAILAKMEEKQGVEDEELIQAIAKEIESLGEVMSNNEKIETEMEANLERNLKEKKQIEEKMLAASSQYASNGNTNKYYESLDRSFEKISGDKNSVFIEKEFIDLHKEKVEKDHKILQLEQEINKMRRELAEKDKLIAQNQPQPLPQPQSRNPPPLQTSSQTHRVSKTPSTTSRAYQPSGASGSQANKSQQQPSHSYGFGQNRDYLRELKTKKAEKHGSMTDVSERPSTYKQQEDTRLSKDMNAEEMMEIVNSRNIQDRYSTVLMKEFGDLTMQRDEKKRNSRFFKGSGLNESGTKTAANTIRQMVKNKYNQATQPVSVEELKDYAEKLKGVNFEAVQKKSKKPPKAYGSPQLNPHPTPISSYYAHLTQQQGGQRVASNDAHKSSKGNFIGKTGMQPGSSQYNQVVGNRGSDKKGSRDATPEKGFSEISSIVMLPNDQSPDQSVDEYILSHAVDDDREKKKYSTVDPRTSNDNQQIQSVASPNFHLNIRYLMSKEETSQSQSQNQPQHHHHHTHSTNPVVSTSKSQERGLTSLLPKGQSQGKISKMLPTSADPDYLLAPQVHLSADKRASEPTMRGTASSHKSKGSPQKDDPPRPNTLYYLNFKRDEAKRSLSREKNAAHAHSVKSQTLDQEGSMSPSIHSQSLTKHMRSTSLHNKQFGALKRQAAANAIMASMEDSNSIQNSTQRLQDSNEGTKKGTNEIRTLEEARDLVRNFRVKLTSLAYVVDKNFVDEKYSQEISNLIKDYNENKYILSSKDQALLSKVEAAILQTERKDSNENQKVPTTEQAYKSTRSVSVNPKVATKYVTTSIKDLETRQDDSPYQIYKKSVDFNGFNDSTSSERGSNHEEKTTNANSSTGQQTKESSLLYSKNKGGLVYSSGRNSNNQTASGNAINIYNQFAMQDIKPFQTNRDVYLSPKTQPEGEVMHSRKDTMSEYGSSRGKANPEVQILIEKQKKNLEELEKKKGMGNKNFDLGFVDVYHTSRPSYQEPRTEVTERGTERGSNRKSINMNQFE